MPLNRLILCSLVYGDEIMRPLLCRFFYGVRTFRLSSATTRLATPILLSLYLYYTLFMQLIGAPPRVCGTYVCVVG